MPQQKPRLDPRMVFAVVLVAIPVLYVVAQVILVRSGADCGEPDHSQVGGLVQMFVPGDACTEEPPGR
jgi:hypothetical protein